MEKTKSNLKPHARTEKLVVQELSDETLVYDLDSHKAHCLNKTASLVWQHCDGKTSVTELTRILSRGSNLPRDEQIVELALQQLDKAKLLEKSDVSKDRTVGGAARCSLARRSRRRGGGPPAGGHVDSRAICRVGGDLRRTRAAVHSTLGLLSAGEQLFGHLQPDVAVGRRSGFTSSIPLLCRPIYMLSCRRSGGRSYACVS